MAIDPTTTTTTNAINPFHYRQNSRDSISTATTTTTSPTENERLLSSNNSTGLTSSMGMSSSTGSGRTTTTTTITGISQPFVGEVDEGQLNTERSTLNIVANDPAWMPYSVGSEPAVSMNVFNNEGGSVRVEGGHHVTRVGEGDPRHHVYATIESSLREGRSYVTRDRGQQQSLSMSQLYQLNQLNHQDQAYQQQNYQVL